MKWYLSMSIMFFIPIVSSANVCVYLFYGATCPHCKEERLWLRELQKKYPQLEVYEFEVYFNESNRKLWETLCKSYETAPVGVPMTFVGKYVFIGFIHGYSKSYDTKRHAYIGYSEFMEKVLVDLLESNGAKCPGDVVGMNATNVVKTKSFKFSEKFLIVGLVMVISSFAILKIYGKK